MSQASSSDVRPSNFRLRWAERIPLRDGTRLSATLYLPAGSAEPAPCIFALTPYTVHRNHFRASYFAAHGYFFLVVDARGRGNSEGEFRPQIQEAQDGFDVVEWIARQPFCNGSVAMFSGSYEGYVQWATAKELPPHLKTIVPAMASAPGIDFPMRNNVAYPYVMQWLTLTAGHTAQERIFEDQGFWRGRFREWYESGRSFRELDTIVGHPSPMFQEWLSHPAADAYWDSFRPTASQYARIDLPVLTLTGSYDGDQPGALHFYREHLRNASPEAAARHYLVIGPWDHAGTLAPKQEFGGLEFGPASLVDVLKLHLEWYDWTLRGASRPAFLKSRVNCYVAVADTWRHADSLDAVTAELRPLYLDSNGCASRIFASGALGNSVGRGGGDTYVHDPRDTRIAEVESALTDPPCLRPTFPTDNLTDQRMVYANEGRQLIYHSTPFEADTEISGFFRLVAWISIDQLDTDFIATVYEITGNGRSVLLSSDILRARYRESLREETLIRTVQPLRYDFERFTFISRLLRRGSRLRLVIGPVRSIFTQKNYNSGKAVAEESVEDARLVTVTLFHDSSHPSALYVPVAHPEPCDA